MREKRTCMRCGSTELTSGWAQSSGKLYFRPDNVKFFSPKTADLSVTGMMCTECGTIEFVGDVHKAQSVIKESRVAS